MFLIFIGVVIIIAAFSLHSESNMGWTRNIIIQLIAGIVLVILGFVLLGVMLYFLSKGY